MIAAAQWLRHYPQILSVKTTLYLIPPLLWLVLIHIELRPGTTTFGLLHLCSVVYPMVKIPHYNTVSFTHFTYSIKSIFSLFCLVMLGQRYTTPMVTVVCPVTNLHHMASLQSASSCKGPCKCYVTQMGVGGV